MKWIIDRIEGEYALAETDNGVVPIPLKALPEEAGEGAVIDITVNKNETQNRKDRINRLMESLFED